MKPTYESPLASRYASKTMLHLFSPDMRYETWRRLWVALARAEHTLGLPVTQQQVDELAAHVSPIDYDAVAKREKEVRHVGLDRFRRRIGVQYSGSCRYGSIASDWKPLKGRQSSAVTFRTFLFLEKRWSGAEGRSGHPLIKI